MAAFSIKTILTEPLPNTDPLNRLLVRSFMLLFSPFIRVENQAHLKDLKSPVLFAFNHNRSMETILVAALLMFAREGRPVSFVIDWMYGKIPPLGWLFNRIDPVYVYNKPARFRWLNKRKPARKSSSVYDECIRKLESGRDIGIFPEGTRNRDPRRLKRGRSGIGKIIAETDCPVVPIGIEYLRRGKMQIIPAAGKIILRIGRPVQFTRDIMEYRQNAVPIEHSEKQKPATAGNLSRIITHRVMEELARLSGKVCSRSQDEPDSGHRSGFRNNNKKEEACLESMP
jgi:1-acyl-sn-glycerol-3-phosphate acyltransferase